MFSDPLKNLKTLGLKENMLVADLGAGTGFYSIAAASLVPNGKVYAIEIQRDYVATIQNKAKEARLNNVECFWGDIEKVGGTKIKDNIIDVVIASNILFQVENKDRFITEAKRILKPECKLLLIDWLDESPLGPSNNSIVTKIKARELLETKGFIFERDIDAGAHHYGMIFELKKNEI